MFYWGIMLFGLGMLALADYSVTRGEIFGTINSIIFLSISLAVFVRMRRKEKEATLEKLIEENNELRHKLGLPETKKSTKDQMQEALA